MGRKRRQHLPQRYAPAYTSELDCSHPQSAGTECGCLPRVLVLEGALGRTLRWYLPERHRSPVSVEWSALTKRAIESCAGAAGSLREGLDETLTLTRHGITGSLKRTLESTNPCESMIECVRRSSRNVKRWQSGKIALRWTAAGMLEAERQFRRLIGYTDLTKLVPAIAHDLARTTVPSPTQEAAILVTA